VNFADFFIRRPIFAGVLSVLIFLVGLLSMRVLPISEYPEVVPPTIVVRAAYPGANPRTISETVAAPLEQAINGVENSIYMSSQSTADGVMTLTVTFRLGTDADLAQVQVQNRVSQALPKLPEEVRRLGVTTIKQSPDLTMVVHLYSPDGRYDDIYLRNYASLQVRDVLARLPGVGGVELFGSGEYAMRIWLDPEKCASRELTTGDVIAAIREQNVQVAAGSIGTQPQPTAAAFELAVNAKGRLVSEEEFGQIVVKTGPNGEQVLLKHVARIELAAGEYGLRSLLDNQQAIAIPIFQAPGSNAIGVSDAVRGAMEDLATAFPEGLEYRIVYDPTVFVRQSIKKVVVTLFEAIGLVVLVVIVFLQTWRASLIPLAAVPVSLVGTFAAMQALGFGINALSLFGLVLAIGIVVDDAIVVVENVERNIRLGKSPMEATRQAMREVTGPIIATALVLAAVFIPAGMITGLTGQFYKQFAITIAISTAISAFNSLTLSPALCALLLKPHGARPDALTRGIDFLLGWFFRPFNRGFAWASEQYGRTVAGLIRVAAVAVILYLGLVALTGFTFTKVPAGFIPTQDKQYLVAFTQLPDGASIDRTDAVIREMSRIALAHPGVESTVAFPGLSINGFVKSSSAGIIFLGLKPFEDRHTPDLAGPAIAGQLTKDFGSIQEAFVLCVPPPAVMGLGTVGGFQLYVEDRAAQGYDALHRAAWSLVGAARQDATLSNVISGFQINVPQLEADVDRAKAKAQGVPLASVFETMQVYLGSLYVNDFNRFGRTYQVIAQADAPFRDEASDVELLRTRNQAGEMVPLSALVEVRESYGPDRVPRYNGYPAAEVLGGPAPGKTSGEAEAAIAKLADQVLESGMKYEWTDLVYQRILAGDSSIYVFPLSILLVLLVLAAQYESFRLPLAVVLIVPLTLLSAFVGVLLTRGENNIFTQIGLIVLIGLAAKNAILIVEFAKAKQDEGASPRDAAIEAARLRLRPILMTSIAFIAGVYPLVVSTGAGAEMRRAMGVAVFSGMIGVTFFGLLLTPVFYFVLMRIGWRPGQGSGHGSVQGPETLALAHSGAGHGELPGHGSAQAEGHGGHGPKAHLWLPFVLLPLLVGCQLVGQDYERPAVPELSGFADQVTPGENNGQSAQPGESGNAEGQDLWQLGEPREGEPRGAWWRLFGDAELDQLEAQAAQHNQNLAQAIARLKQAQSAVRGARAGRLPTLDFNPNFSRTRYSPNAGLAFPIDSVSNFRFPLEASYEVDLFGRVSREIEAARESAMAQEYSLESLRLSLHAEVAVAYFGQRALEGEEALLQRTLGLREEALTLERGRFEAGRGTELDVARAEAELASTEAELKDVARRRSELQTAIAVLCGAAPEASAAAPRPYLAPAPPELPVGLPSTLLERRPDVAAAERQLAAQNAAIGIAAGAYFPRLRITGYGGYESADTDRLFEWSSRIWSLVPSLSIPLFRGGRLKAEEARAKAAHEEALAAYRQSILVAFKEVQDGLIASRLLSEQSAAISRALEASQRASRLARQRYDAGLVGYLDVLESERNALTTERTDLQLKGARLQNAVYLVRALGGGWQQP
jgi:multidrug efflux pump